MTAGTRDWHIAIVGLIMFLFRATSIYGLWFWKVMELLKCNLMGYSSRNMEDIGAEGDRNCGDSSCDAYVENIVPLCPCLNSLPEMKVKRFIIPLTKDVSRVQYGSSSGLVSSTVSQSHSKLRMEKYKMFT